MPELIAKLAPGEEVLILQNDRPIAKLVGEPAASRQPRQPGSAKGKLTILADDEAHLHDFKEYLP
ncbi:MAG: antitoxin of toxin-antitoxin stability system [Acidobacteria bacterium]|nr:antitoxin of toxin-antitoxin stability system [Acidobacteriota bacterium]MCI0720354.1 antitoxin of toxin-antitoxin stability system [Acidobacteriota bacterium]